LQGGNSRHPARQPGRRGYVSCWHNWHLRRSTAPSAGPGWVQCVGFPFGPWGPGRGLGPWTRRDLDDPAIGVGVSPGPPRGPAVELVKVWNSPGCREEADALTNKDFGMFDPARRVAVHVGSLPFLVLPDLERVAEDIYRDVQAREAAGPARPAAPRTRKGGLRIRGPWQ